MLNVLGQCDIAESHVQLLTLNIVEERFKGDIGCCHIVRIVNDQDRYKCVGDVGA